MTMLRYLAILCITISYAVKGSALSHPPLEGFKRALTDTWSEDLYEYKLVKDQDTWENHRQYAQDWGGDLVSMHSRAESDFVNTLREGESVLAGGYRKSDDPHDNDFNTWLWSDGTSFDFVNWRSNQPNNYWWSNDPNAEVETVMGFYSHNAGWDDFRETDRLGAVYKKSINFDHWEINTVNTSIVEDDGPLIQLKFNISNRDHSTQVLQDDCETSFTGLAKSGISSSDANVASSGQFVQYDTLIKINHTAFITNDTYWTNVSDTLGYMEICVLTELYLDGIEPKETVNFLSNLINITYDTDGNFEVSNINVTRTGPEESEVSVDYSTYLVAYQCTPDNLSVESTQTYSQGSVLVVCVKGDGNIVTVESIKQLSVNQGSSPAFEYISDTNGYNAAIVSTDCQDVDSNPICSAQLRLLGRFFSSDNPDNLRVTGSVTMSFPSNSERHLSHRQYNDLKKSRYLQDVSDSGTFNVEAELEKVKDSVKSQSILSGNRKHYLSLVALSYVFGIVWCIV